YVTRYFTAKYDYLNAKTLAKCKYMRKDGLPICFDCADIAPAVMKEYINGDDYSAFPPRMADALSQIDEKHAEGKCSARFIDVVLDKAMYADMAECAAKSKWRALRSYHEYCVDVLNLTTLYRSKKAGLSAEEWQEYFLPKCTFTAEFLLQLWDLDARQGADKIPTATLRDFVRRIADDSETGKLTAEDFADRQKYNLLTQSPDSLTVAPLVCYYRQKIDEIDKIRFAVIGIKNGLDRDVIKERLK
ncbi:MAG: V-type ATPase subunit, partial [Corallococcus sp.]|nr:V-type ATPase subunit [Corallococcus sp.]